MRRLAILSILCAAMLSAQTLTLTGPARVRPGTTVPVTLTLAVPPPSLAATQWTLTLPSGYTATAIAGAATMAAEKILYCRPDATLCLTVAAGANLYAGGVVATYQMTVPANAPAGNVTVPLLGIIGSALDGSSAPLGSGIPFAFAVLARTDLNGDGVTDKVDLNLMIQEVLSGGPPSTDPDGDGLATVKDAQIVARAMAP